MGRYKKLEKRLNKIEKHLVLNTEVTVSKMESVEELPEKWCVKMDNIEVVDYCNDNGEYPPYSLNEKIFAQFPSIDRRTGTDNIADGYTEITFDQFKKWVLKEDSKTPEIEGIKKPLSIREVQVKVTAQEEANECAEIAKACGEKILGLMVVDICCYFTKTTYGFAVSMKKPNKTEISIQEYRDRFGKAKTEIDWNKRGQLVENEDAKWIVVSDHSETHFLGVFIYSEEPNQFLYRTTTVLKEDKKLCTEPITLKNE